MRNLIVVAALSIVSATWPGAAPAAEPEKPVAAAPAPPAGAAFKEPDMKPPKHSGGVSSSPLIKNAPLPDDHVMGKATAPLVMVEYASMSCPHCAHFSTVILPQLEKDYIQTGKMRYILRQFPLNEPALKAAMLLDCVGAQSSEKYYVFVKVLFDAQSKWAYDSQFLAGLETIATVGGLSKEQFQGCVTPTEREMKILKKKKETEESVKIAHTPYIFVGGEVFDGERSVESVTKFIDKKLAELEKKEP